MEQNQDVCPHCGSLNMTEGKQFAQGAVWPTDSSTMWRRGAALYHVICKDCGTVVRSYVEQPNKL